MGTLGSFCPRRVARRRLPPCDKRAPRFLLPSFLSAPPPEPPPIAGSSTVIFDRARLRLRRQWMHEKIARFRRGSFEWRREGVRAANQLSRESSWSIPLLNGEETVRFFKICREIRSRRPFVSDYGPLIAIYPLRNKQLLSLIDADGHRLYRISFVAVPQTVQTFSASKFLSSVKRSS